MKKNPFCLIIAGLLFLLILSLAAVFHLLGGFNRISAFMERRKIESEDKHLSLREEEITIPGLSHDYQLLFLSDTHVVTDADTDSSDVSAYARSRLPMFVNREGMTSARQFSGWIKTASEKQVDAVVLGGDIIDSPSDSNLAFLSAALGRLKMPYLYAPGNHDWTYPWAYLNDHAKDCLRPLLSPFMNGNPSFQTLRLNGLTIAAVDNSSDQVDPSVLEPLSELLAENIPVILLMHVPLYEKGLADKAAGVWGSPIILGDGGISPDETSRAFFNLIYAKDSPVIAVLSGHVHFSAKVSLPHGITQYVAGAGYQGEGLLIHIRGENK